MLSRSPGSATRAGLNRVIRAPSMAAACRLYFLVCDLSVNIYTEIVSRPKIMCVRLIRSFPAEGGSDGS